MEKHRLRVEKLARLEGKLRGGKYVTQRGLGRRLAGRSLSCMEFFDHCLYSSENANGFQHNPLCWSDWASTYEYVGQTNRRTGSLPA
eukprot:scaffold27225_cov80-Skeletonema_dohrnii-CCMP3373.AAC.2